MATLLSPEQTLARELMQRLVNPDTQVGERALDFLYGLIEGRYRCEKNEHRQLKCFPQPDHEEL